MAETVSLYFEVFQITQPIEVNLLEGERIVNVMMINEGVPFVAANRQVWIEGTRLTAIQRFYGRPNAVFAGEAS